jgi:hypothetical protein
MVKRLLLYARTVRHLRPVQWWYLPVRRIQAVLPQPSLAQADAPPRADPAPLAAALVRWGPGDAEGRLSRAREVRDGVFTFVGHTERLERVDWTRRYTSHLWSYNLHYFDYALDLAWAARLTGEAAFARRFAALATEWVDATAPGRGDGWEPYALSVRVVNWSYALLLLGDALDPPVRERLWGSVHRQLRYLERRLELHLLANHYLRNLRALVVGGLVFRGADAQRWAGFAGRLWDEVHEQVLPDGGHFERSPMYHAATLADLLEVADLLRAAGGTVPSSVVARLEAMADATALLARPDGTLHRFNDAADGIAPARPELDAFAAIVLGRAPVEPDGPFALPDTGYFGVVEPGGDRLVIDCGEPGPAYQMGHAHCDLLSFELDLDGRPVVVDSGTPGYAGDPLRAYCRSTRAHNTVQVDDREQSEAWGVFRVARRAAPRSAAQSGGRADYRFRGSCVHQDGQTVHHRQVAREGRAWVVEDRVEGAAGRRVTSYLHLHPRLEVAEDGGGWIARAAGERVRIEPFGGASVRLVKGESDPAQGWFCPRFGERIPAPVLELTMDRYDGSPFGYRMVRDDG